MSGPNVYINENLISIYFTKTHARADGASVESKCDLRFNRGSPVMFWHESISVDGSTVFDTRHNSLWYQVVSDDEYLSMLKDKVEYTAYLNIWDTVDRDIEIPERLEP